MEENVFIALGSNEGDRELNLLRAVAEVGKLPETKVTALSSFYETSPVSPIPQGDYLNAVIRISTSLLPEDLLQGLQRIESQVFHRVRSVPSGPRAMDLDILFYGNLVICTASLILPHPRLHERRFVLEPLFDIAPDFVHPVRGETVSRMRSGLPPGERVVKI